MDSVSIAPVIKKNPCVGGSRRLCVKYSHDDWYNILEHSIFATIDKTDENKMEVHQAVCKIDDWKNDPCFIMEHEPITANIETHKTSRHDKKVLSYSRDGIRLVIDSTRMVETKGSFNEKYYVFTNTYDYVHWIEVEHYDYNKIPMLPYMGV